MRLRSNKKSKGNLFFRFVFSRSMVTVLLLAVQIGYLIVGYQMLGKYMTFVTDIMMIACAFLVIHLVNDDESSAYNLSWMVLIFVTPVFGVFLYFFVKGNAGHRWIEDSMKQTIAASKDYMLQDEEIEKALEKEDVYVSQLASYIRSNGFLPTYSNNDVVYFPDGASKKEELIRQLKKAEKFIFMEYFIIEKGEFWDEVLEVLRDKAASGIEVRVMYDGMCSLIYLPYSYPKKLQKMGIKSRMYAPIKPMLSTHQNNRDHRKTVVIDGKVAFNGGINIGDEYTNRKEVYGYWKDCSVMVTGDAVRSYTAMFLQTWNALRKVTYEDFGKYINQTPLNHEIRNGYVIPYCDGPYQKENLAENIYIHTINTARDYVHIMTPYLILDHELLHALKYAAKRGVDVRILLPHIPDKKLVFYIARTYYPELIAAGVKIFEFTPGFVHAKVFVADGESAIVGSINLDFRSLYLHFENATYLYRNDVVPQIEEDYLATLKQSEQIKRETYYKFPIWMRALGRILKVFGPLV